MRITKAKQYDKLGELEVKRYKDFDVIEEYEFFYLCGKFINGKLLYKECFSKFDIDGVPKTTTRVRKTYDTKMHRGGC